MKEKYEDLSGLRVLLVVPGSVSYFYNAEGYRVARALKVHGCTVDVATLPTVEPKSYDWCFFLNLWEIMYANNHDRADTLRRINRIKKHCRRTGLILLEAVKMKWFRDSLDLFNRAKLDVLLDLGLHDQSQHVKRSMRSVYHFVFNGLTQDEQQLGLAYLNQREPRRIPWCFVGHMTRIRLSFLEYLVNNIRSDGMVYMVRFGPVTEDGPHLNNVRYKRVLSESYFQIWSSHHQYFYMESIRFRTSYLTGSLPIKVNMIEHADVPDVPFNSLIYTPEVLENTFASFDFYAMRDEFVREFCALPSLEQSLAQSIIALG